jgi:probable HAF family extracellular repeat protein
MFMGLGDLPGGSFYSAAFDVSADGSIVVGESNPRAFRWEAGSMIPLDDISASVFPKIARGVSPNGGFIVGVLDTGAAAEAFVWQGGVTTGLGIPPGGHSDARGVSDDGLIIVGDILTNAGYEAVRWEDGAMIPLGYLEGGGSRSYATDVSADGSVIVGGSDSTEGWQPFLWENGVMIGLGNLPGGIFDGYAEAVSGDGRIVIGESYSDLGQEAFRWESGAMQGLGMLPGATISLAQGLSADGSVIVGRCKSSAGYWTAFIWDSIHGMRNLQEFLEADLGLDLTGWTLDSAHAVSDDGRTIVGEGVNPSGFREAWIAQIPPPTAIPLSIPVTQTGMDVGFAIDHSFQIQVDTQLFGQFQANNVGSFLDATQISGLIEADLDIPDSISLVSVELDSDAPLAGAGSAGSVNVDEISIDLIFSVPAGLESPLIEIDPTHWLYGGNSDLLGRFEVWLTISIPSIFFYATPFEVGPFVYEPVSIKTLAGEIEDSGSGVITLLLQLVGSNVRTFHAAAAVNAGLPAGINEVRIVKCCGGTDSFKIDWANDFEVIGAPEPSSPLLIFAGVGVLLALARLRGVPLVP